MHTNSLGIILAKVNRHTYYYFLGVFNSYMLRMAACTAYWLFTASALVSIITLALKWRVNTSAMHTVRILHALVTFWTKPAWMTHTFTRNSTTSMNAIISANGCKNGNRILSNKSFSVTKSLGKNETYVYGKTFPSILLHKYIAKGLHKIRSDNQVRSRICHKVLQTFQFKTHFKIDSKLKRKCFVRKLTIPPHIHIGLVQCNFHFGKKCH